VLKVGDKAPLFELEDERGEVFRLADHAGEKVLLVFYPGDNTPVCTAQLCDYRDGIEAFEGLGVSVVGISGDDGKSHRAFRDKHDLPFSLLCDPGQKVARQYGVKGLLGPKRSIFLVDESGSIPYLHVESLSLFRRKRDELLSVIQSLS
jgi:peroxiredoxin Q/BCP